MASMKKMLKLLQNNMVLILVVAAAVGFVLYSYSSNKNQVVQAVKHDVEQKQESFNAANPEGENGDFASVNGVKTSDQMPSPCSKKDVVDPAQLLPKNVKDNEFAKLNPKGAGSLEGVNLLTAGYQIGIDTIGTSLRNANLQVRSEPANPKANVGPWNNSTITHEIRPSLEIGCGPSVCSQ